MTDTPDIEEHNSAYEDMRFVDGFIEVFQYSDGTLSIAMGDMSEQAVCDVITELQAKLDQPDDPSQRVH